MQTQAYPVPHIRNLVLSLPCSRSPSFLSSLLTSSLLPPVYPFHHLLIAHRPHWIGVVKDPHWIVLCGCLMYSPSPLTCRINGVFDVSNVTSYQDTLLPLGMHASGWLVMRLLAYTLQKSLSIRVHFSSSTSSSFCSLCVTFVMTFTARQRSFSQEQR